MSTDVIASPAAVSGSLEVSPTKKWLDIFLRQCVSVIKFVIYRLPYNILLLFVSTFLSYVLAALSFNPLSNYLGRNPQPSAQVLATISQKLNLNGNIFGRYFHWLFEVIFHGNFGVTIAQSPVNDELWARLGISIRLVVPGAIFGLIIGVLVGYYAALRQYHFWDHLATALTFLSFSAPVLVSAPLLKWLGVYINGKIGHTLFLYTGETSAANNSPWYDLFNFTNLGDRVQHLIIPTIVLILVFFPSYSRYMRGSTLDELGQDYIRTARAKGLTRGKAINRHAFRTALIPLSTTFAYSIGGIITGAIYTEKMFGWHGIGEWMINGVTTQDINITMACMLFTGLSITLSRVLADLFLGILDPRVRNRKK